jgi:hypothetical protein
MSAAQSNAPAASLSTRFRIDTSKAEGESPGILITHTTPESIQFHLVEDHELETLMNLSLPLSFGVCTTALGAALGFTPDAIGVITDVKEASPVSVADLATSFIWIGCLVTFVITGLFTIGGARQTRTVLNNIRSRPRNPLSVGSRPAEVTKLPLNSAG